MYQDIDRGYMFRYILAKEDDRKANARRQWGIAPPVREE
jgi:hypothetical protein